MIPPDSPSAPDWIRKLCTDFRFRVLYGFRGSNGFVLILGKIITNTFSQR